MIRTLGAVRIRESHCVRIRYANSTCERCAKACQHGAISYSPGPVIDERKCTGCMACVSACRTAALEAPTILFWATLRSLADVPSSVLGCDLGPDEDAPAHAKVPCVGYLAPEQIVALAVFLPEPVSLDLTRCAQCENARAAEQASVAIRSIRESLPTSLADRLRIASSVEDDLDYVDPLTDRRGFLAALGSLVRNQVASVLAETADTDVGDTPFWEKIVPRERVVFERSVEALRQNEDVEGLSAVCRLLGATARVSDRCHLCLGCVGMCPNGALDSVEQEIELEHAVAYVEELRFNASRCGSCGVCSEFCSARAIEIMPGSEPDRTADWIVVRSSKEES